MRGRRRRPPESRRMMSGAVRRVCNSIAAMVTVYALIARDVPVGLVAFAVLLGNCQTGDQIFRLTVGAEISKAVHACSITIFIGAIFLLFFY